MGYLINSRNDRGISVYGRYIPPEEAPVVEKAVFRDLRRCLAREGDIRTKSEIFMTAYKWTQERVKRL